MKRKTLADGFKGITGIETSLPYQEENLPYVPLGNIPELKIIELLKDIRTYLIILIGIASIILGTIIGRFVL